MPTMIFYRLKRLSFVWFILFSLGNGAAVRDQSKPEVDGESVRSQDGGQSKREDDGGSVGSEDQERSKRETAEGIVRSKEREQSKEEIDGGSVRSEDRGQRKREIDGKNVSARRILPSPEEALFLDASSHLYKRPYLSIRCSPR